MEVRTDTSSTSDASCSVRPGVTDSATLVAAATRDATVDAGQDRRPSTFVLLLGCCLRDVITATRQLGADVEVIVVHQLTVWQC